MFLELLPQKWPGLTGVFPLFKWDLCGAQGYLWGDSLSPAALVVSWLQLQSEYSFWCSQRAWQTLINEVCQHLCEQGRSQPQFTDREMGPEMEWTRLGRNPGGWVPLLYLFRNRDDSGMNEYWAFFTHWSLLWFTFSVALAWKTNYLGNSCYGKHALLLH